RCRCTSANLLRAAAGRGRVHSPLLCYVGREHRRRLAADQSGRRAITMSPEPWVLALDIGTSSARALVFDSNGRAIPGLRAQTSYAIRTSPPCAATLAADELIQCVAGCIDTVLDSADKTPIAAVGISTFWHSMVGADRNGQAITPLYTWADTRAADAAKKLRESLDSAAVHGRTGSAIHPSSFPD